MNATINSNPSRAGTHTRLALGRGAVKAAFPSALKINKILLPTDFSAPSQKALRYAKSPETTEILKELIAEIEARLDENRNS